jgi:phosphoglycolate phosphatase
MKSAVQNIIFDLDGTLVDSAPVFVSVLNEMLEERGSARRVALDQVRQIASHGGPALVQGALAEECGELSQEVADFRARYALCQTPLEAMYAGVSEGLKELANLGFKLAICSNKPQHLCEKVIADLNLQSLFEIIIGSSPGRQPKPEPELMHLTLSSLHANPSRCIYVGDSEVDHALAAATGIRFLFVSYGYADPNWDRSDIVEFSGFADLVQALKAERGPARPLRNVA